MIHLYSCVFSVKLTILIVLQFSSPKDRNMAGSLKRSTREKIFRMVSLRGRKTL